MPAANALPDDQCFRLAMQSVDAGMALIDLSGHWVEVNPALARLLGHDDASLLRGQRVADMFHPDDADTAHAYLTTLADTSGPGSGLPQRYRNRMGSVLQARAEVSVVRDQSGVPSYLVMHLREPGLRNDKTRELQLALTESEQALQSLVRQHEVVAHGISHDLRAPLRAIESFSSLLESRSGATLDETGRNHLARIRAAAARMGGLIDALLDLGRVDRAGFKPGTVDISLLADWAAAELQDAHPGRSADITVAPGLSAHGDERLLRTLLKQLLDNAWRFSGDRDQVRIQIDGGVAGGNLQVNVRDHGSGFDMRYADKVFEPFQRLHTPEQGAGNGLGLAIAKRIVERHGGWIRAQSHDGGGSVFTFELPAAPADTVSDGQVA